jgi:hypothetical protein
MSRLGLLAAARVVAVFAACRLLAGCASAPSRTAPTAAASPAAEQDPATPPDGASRLPASIDCEPRPPCEGCLTYQGVAARHVGSLDKEDIRGVIRSHLLDVKACYDAVETTHPSAAGQMMVRFGIDASGGVRTSCLVSSELHDTRVERCVVDLPLAWRFPQPQGGGWVVVSYPFVFTR